MDRHDDEKDMGAITVSRPIDAHDIMIGEQQQRIDELEAHLQRIQDHVNRQAEDEALWEMPGDIVNGYILQELKALHKTIEGD